MAKYMEHGALRREQYEVVVRTMCSAGWGCKAEAVVLRSLQQVRTCHAGALKHVMLELSNCRGRSRVEAFSLISIWLLWAYREDIALMLQETLRLGHPHRGKTENSTATPMLNNQSNTTWKRRSPGLFDLFEVVWCGNACFLSSHLSESQQGFGNLSRICYPLDSPPHSSHVKDDIDPHPRQDISLHPQTLVSTPPYPITVTTINKARDSTSTSPLSDVGPLLLLLMPLPSTTPHLRLHRMCRPKDPNNHLHHGRDRSRPCLTACFC